MVEGPGRKPPTFTQLHERHGPGLFGSGEDEYLHAEDAGPKQIRLYTQAHFIGSVEEVQAKIRERQNAAQFVRQAMTRDYGDDVVEAVLRKLHVETGLVLDAGMTRGDLKRLRQGLERQSEELQMLQERVRRMPGDTPQKIKDELVDTWHTVGADIRTIRWPNSDAEVRLRDQICGDYLDDRNNVEFNEEEGTLTLTMGEDAASREKKMTALANFIGRHFEAEPGQPAFDNIANNILSYLHQGLSAGMVKKMNEVANGAAFPSGNAAPSTYKLSVSKDEDGKLRSVGVACDVSTLYQYPPGQRRDDASARAVDFSKYTFVRRQGFEISGDQLSEKLRSDRFDPEANLGFVSRIDTINLASSEEVLAGQGAIRA
jgi:hypothetical protein